MRAFIQLGKAGDILSVLPILYHLAKAGKVPWFIVSKEYAPLLEGTSYVNPVIWPGDAFDAAGALTWAKKKFALVRVLQTFGNLPVQQATPSFQLDQWRRAGCLENFEEWPLVMDRRDTAREGRLLAKVNPTRPFILFGDHSRSSPFLQKEELAAMLKSEFPGHALIRLSEVRAERLYDLLALYDLADCLVTVETAHVHLSKASRVPTVVLAADGWRGSAWHPKFALHLRYAAWERRKDRVIETMRRAVECRSLPVVETSFDTPDHGYNPSICNHGGQSYACYRFHPNGDWKTQLMLNGRPLRVSASLRDFSVEDCRLFVFRDKLHGSYTVSTAVDGRFGAYVAYGEIKDGEIGHQQIRYPGNDLLGMQKNWCPFVHDDRLHFIYGIRETSQIVLAVEHDQVQAEYQTPAPAWPFGEIRGGAVLPHQGHLLRFFHSRVGDYYNGKYFVGASLMEARPPFKTLAVSSKPILEGDEQYRNIRHWKARVVFPLGVVKKPNGKFVLSYGHNDCACRLAEFGEEALNL